MLARILTFLASLGIGSIANKLAAAHETKAKAATDQERLRAEERIKTLELRRDAQVALGRWAWIPALVRFLFALPFVIYNAKLVVWDKVLSLGATDPLSPELVDLQLAVIGFYFLSEAGLGVARIAKRG